MKADHRNEDFSKATLLNSESLKLLKIGDDVRVSGMVSDKNPKLFENFILATKEIKVKKRDRSVWETSESFIGPLLLSLDDGLEISVNIAPEYVPCGDGIKVVLPERTAKERTLGLESSKPMTGYGKLVSLNPILVDLGKSPCSETLGTYTGSLQNKISSYALAALFLAVPSLFLIYLGLYSRKVDNN